MRWLSWSMRTSEETLHPNFGESINAKFRIRLLDTWAAFSDGAPPAETRAHRSDGQCQRIRLTTAAPTCGTPMPRMRLWDSLLLTKPPT